VRGRVDVGEGAGLVGEIDGVVVKYGVRVRVGGGAVVPGTSGEAVSEIRGRCVAAGGKSVAEREGVGGTGVEADRVQAVNRSRKIRRVNVSL
jgi:hypothetical protein